MKQLLSLFFLFWTSTTFAQSISKLTTEQIKEDVLFLEAALIKYNPTLYVYNSKELLTKRWERIGNAIHAPLDAASFYKLLCSIATEANEAHVKVGTEAAEFYSGFFEGKFKSLPLNIEYLGERAYLWRNFSQDSSLERGDEILTINGRSMAEIRQEIFKYTASDGVIETFKQMRLNTEFSARYYWFVEQVDSFKIEYKKRGSAQQKNTTIIALTQPEMVQFAAQRLYKDKRPKGIEKVYSFRITNGIGYLTMPSFDEEIIKEYAIVVNELYEAIFKELRQNKTPNLIIDVRDNIGGIKEFGDGLLPFVLKQNQKGIYRELVSWNGEVVASYFPKRHKNYFKGKIYILTNGGTFSTAAHIAKYLREFADATVIGEETGSRYEGFAAGTFQYIQLPNSKVTVGIPNKWVKNLISNKQQTTNRGLLPEYPITTTIEDLLEGKDKALEKALELIQLSKK